jgi:hypothetical protein
MPEFTVVAKVHEFPECEPKTTDAPPALDIVFRMQLLTLEVPETWNELRPG